MSARSAVPPPTHRRRVPAPLRALALAAALCMAALAVEATSATAATPLSGTLAIAPGKYVAAKHGKAAHYTGSYFRMLLPGATDKYFHNPNSKAKDKTYTLFIPGSQRGLRLGSFQPPPISASPPPPRMPRAAKRTSSRASA
jgi:hypothetical protein